MITHLLTALYLTLPLVVSATLHMGIVRFDLFSRLKVPVHQGLFGANKTWRGMVVMPVLTVIGVVVVLPLDSVASGLSAHLAAANPVVLGVLLGLGYVLAELPNSYVKRRLGIPPGKRPERNPLLFTFVDQADSAFGCTLVYAITIAPPWPVLVILILLGPAIHLIGNVSLYLVGLRREPL